MPTQPITARELRIGNLILDDNGMMAIVTGFTPYGHSTRCDEEEGCDLLIDIIQIDGTIDKGYEVDINLTKPISLSPEWLERFGFELVSGCYWTLNGLSFCHEDNDPGYWEASTGIGIYPVDCPSIQFVHELQNMFFVMRGSDLQTK